ncbi:MAG: hypothetical protein ACRDYY_03960 [Acidimicrobiales bacterium]
MAAAVDAGVEGRARATAVVRAVVVYGTRLPNRAQLAFAERAANCEIERADLGPFGWAQRTVEAHMTALSPSCQSVVAPAAVETDLVFGTGR